MVIRLGDRRTHHFAHKSGSSNCSSESVWHQSAKLLFLQTYRDCVAAQRPFLLTWHNDATCTHYQQHGYRCAIQRKKQMDLAAEYPKAILEGNIDNYRADVLLTSTTNIPLLIEFAVTHTCTPEKIASGHQIIEISIRGEDDVARLANPDLDTTQTGLVRYNFTPELESGDYCDGECDHILYVLRVYRNHSAQIESVIASEIFMHLDPHVCHQEVLGDKGHVDAYEQAFKQALVRYWSKGNEVRNCYLCVYHGSCGGRYQVFCKIRKQDFESTEAISCNKFRPFKTAEDYVLQERENQHFKSIPWGSPMPPRSKR